MAFSITIRGKPLLRFWRNSAPMAGTTTVTPLGTVFLVIAGLFYVASMTSQSGLLLLLIGLFGAVFLVNYVGCRRAVRDLRVIAPADVTVQQGERAAEPWKVVNEGKRPAQMILVSSSAGELLRIAQIGAGESYAAIPEVTFDRRGVYPYQEIAVTSVAPFGLLRAAKLAGVQGRAIVYPRLYPIESPGVGGSETVTGGKLKGRGRTLSGAHFAGVRPWEAGDAYRSIHWKSSATQQKLMVKLFEEELAGKITVVMAFEPGDEQAEQCIAAAGSIALQAMEEGHQVEFLVAGEAKALLLMPFGDPHELLLKLAEIPNGLNPSVPSPLLSDLPMQKRGALCFCLSKITDAWTNQLQEYLAQNRKIALFLPRGTDSASVVEGLQGVGFHSFGEPVPSHDKGENA